MTRRRFAAAALALLLVTGCGPESAGGPPARPVVVATVPMIADLVREIVGDAAAVETLLKEGVDPHSYVPTAADVKRMTAADLVLYNGLLLEGQMQDVLEEFPKSHAVAESLPEDSLRIPPDFGGHPDPHVWMDVSLWRRTVPGLVDKLSEVLPESAEAFRRNADRLDGRLARLDEYVRATLSTIPEDRRRLVTAHDAFGYFGDAYGIDVFAVQGVSTESDAGVEDVNRLVKLIVAEDIPAVFMETNVSDRLLNAVIRGAEEQGVSVVAGGPLYSDSTGPAGTWEATYFGMIDHNVGDIASRLGGEVPEGGFRGAEQSHTTERR